MQTSRTGPGDQSSGIVEPASPTSGLSEDLTPGQREQVLSHLEEVMSSAALRTSKRSQELLRFIIVAAVEGRTELLKERCIGVEVFKRPAAYNTTEDAIVRVSVSELRRRLTQFYEENPGSAVRIELPAGSYVPRFCTRQETTGPAPAPASAPTFANETIPSRARSLTKPLAVACIVLVLAAAGFWWRARPYNSAVNTFWQPVVGGSSRVLIAMAQPTVFHISTSLRHRAENRASPAEVFPWEVRPQDITPVSDQYVGTGDAGAAAALSGLLGRLGKTTETRFGGEVSFADLKSSPAILLGGFSNAWTMRIANELRFTFAHKDGQFLIRDSRAGREWKAVGTNRFGHADEDYAIVTRISEIQGTGQTLVVCAGITQHGTHAAGEFLVSEPALASMFRLAPAGWSGKNIQVLLHTKVHSATASRADIVAAHFW